jgi:hypothetical protein
MAADRHDGSSIRMDDNDADIRNRQVVRKDDECTHNKTKADATTALLVVNKESITTCFDVAVDNYEFIEFVLVPICNEHIHFFASTSLYLRFPSRC